MDEEEITIESAKRHLENAAHILKQLAAPHPPNGAELTLAMRKAQEGTFYCDLAKKEN